METFAQYLINKLLPSDVRCTKQINKKELDRILIEVGRKHPDRYDEVVVGLKNLGDKFSTYDAVTMGITEISTPNKERRDQLVKKYTALTDADLEKGDKHSLNEHLRSFQEDLAKNDLSTPVDDASLMVSSSMSGKKLQLMKLRTSPGVVGDNNGDVVPVIFDKSYAEGVNPTQFFLGSAESRKNLADGQVNTAKPGELTKVFSNLLATSVVSTEDCGTQQGLLFPPRDDSILNRYLARDTAGYPRNTLITADIQQEFLRRGIAKVLVRSPQTCEADAGSVCQKCMGVRNATAKPYKIGDNAGLITTGSIAEPIQQMVISSKHSTTLAGGNELLQGEAGVRKLLTMPKQYTNRKILCEIIGEVYQIRMAPQGGQYIIIRQTQKVPERYIVNALPVEHQPSNFLQYHIPPNLRIAEGVEKGVKVYPGMALSTGDENMMDVARLRNLGYVRSATAENVYQVYKNTGQDLDRRHFELLARNVHPFVRIIKSPQGASFVPGEVIPYEKFRKEVASMPQTTVKTGMATGKVLGKGVLDISAGTEIDSQVKSYLEENGVDTVSVVQNVEVAPETTSVFNVVNTHTDWVSGLNHRYLKQQIIDAASFGHKSDIHGYNPNAAYAFGAEFGQNRENPAKY